MNRFRSASQSPESKNESCKPTYAVSDDRFIAIYQEYYSLLVTQAQSIVGYCMGEEDIVQEVFIRFWNMRNRSEHIKDIKSFLQRMVYNESVDEMRRRKMEKGYSQYFLNTQCSSKNVTQEMTDLVRSEQFLKQAIANLSPQRRKVFILSKLQGYSRKKIAQLLSVSEMTVRESLRLSIKSVRNYVQEHADLQLMQWKKAIIKQTDDLWINEEKKSA